MTVSNTYAEAKKRAADIILRSEAYNNLVNDAPVRVAWAGNADRDVMFQVEFRELETKALCTFHFNHVYDQAASVQEDADGNRLQACSLRVNMAWKLPFGRISSRDGVIISNFYLRVSRLAHEVQSALIEMGQTWEVIQRVEKSTVNTAA